MRTIIIIIIVLIILGITGYFIISILNNATYENISDEEIKEMSYPVFAVGPEPAGNEKELAIYLYSQLLELGKQGKLITSSTYNNGEWQYKADKLKDYKINDVNVYKDEGDTSDTFKFTVSYNVLPKNRISSDWLAGNGVDGKYGWIIDKYAFVEFKKERNGYRFVIEGTGP